MSPGQERFVLPLPRQDDGERSSLPRRRTRQNRWGRRFAGRSTKPGNGSWPSKHADGSWCAELEGDTILESETILLLAFLGHEDSDLARRLAAYLSKSSFPTAAGPCIPAARLEISGSVKAYFALKLTGHDPSAEYMQRARAGDPGPRRGRRGQQLHPLLPGPAGPDFLRPMPGRAAGSGAAAQVVPGQSLCRQRLVADDHRAAVDHLGAVGRCGGSSRGWASASCSCSEPENWPPLRCPGLDGRHGPVELGPLLPHDRRGC